jgi:rod shape-determining protein MreC
LNSKIPVTINSGQAQAIMTGYNIEYPVLKHVSNTSNSFEKAIVTTSGIGGVFPAGLPIGEVRFLRADPKDKESDLTMVVVPFSKMENIHMVRVLKGYFNPLEKIQDDFPEEKSSKKNKKEH